MPDERQGVKMKTYRGRKTKEISFPLGGIGSGCVGLAGNGALVDWEIFNRPAKGSVSWFTHFAVKAERNGKVLDVRALVGDVYKDFASARGAGAGLSPATMQGFPHFRDWTFRAGFPVAELRFREPAFPATVKMTAFNPLIPLNEDDSGIPAAFFDIAFKNISGLATDYAVCFSFSNPFENSVNTAFLDGALHGVHFTQNPEPDIPSKRGDLCVATDGEEVTVQQYWRRSGWRMDNIDSFWTEFEKPGGLSDRTYGAPGIRDVASVCVRLHLRPGESRSVRFVLSWNIPVCENFWNPSPDGKNFWKNYYTSLFANARASAAYALRNWDRLYKDTMSFRRALFSSTLPAAVLDAISSTLSVLKSPTVLRLEDGTFYGFEGVEEKVGSCEGTCTHVWNYAYALPFLFPALERSIRDADYKYNMDDDGRMQFRQNLPLGRERFDMRACVDGQMGGVIKTYREWKISGDTEWLRKNWPAVKKSLAYAWSDKNPDKWDADKDGVIDGRQHHTLDMELFGPNSWLEGFYLAALKAAAEMAAALNEPDAAAEYEALFERGKRWTDKNLFNGRWYGQLIDLHDRNMLRAFGDADGLYFDDESGEIKYQIGEGCSIDQVGAQWHASLIGLGEIFDRKQTACAWKSIYKHNFKRSMRGFCNCWRLYCVNDEAGAIICDYPKDVRKPAVPVPYYGETMHGFEYMLAASLIMEGMVKEGLTVVAAIRDRYDGEKRNPWNEVECGSNYARSMASYSLLLALSGFTFDMTVGRMGFHPVVGASAFRCFWSLGRAWGTFRQTSGRVSLDILGGTLHLSRLELDGIHGRITVHADGAEVTGCRVSEGYIDFPADGVTVSGRLLIRFDA